MALRLPKALVKELGLGSGTAVEVHLEGDAITIRRASIKYSLEELVSEIRESNRHGEIETGRQGREVW